MDIRCRSSALTDRGKCRRVNEDALLDNPKAGVWVVADGMGGHARGAAASRYVVDAFDYYAPEGTLDAKVQQARRCIEAANDRVYTESSLLARCQVMGSTIAALVVDGDAFAALWAGDSRVYHCRAGQLRRMTRDHSVAQRLVDAGKLKASQAHSHPTASRITRAVGARAEVAVDEVRGRLQAGDRMLLCSDGLTGEVQEVEIATLLTEFDAQTAAMELMALALERGARDNVTVAVLETSRQRPTRTFDPDITQVNVQLSRQAACAGPGS